MAVEKTRKEEERRRGQQIKTAVEPLSAFYLAEDYHQKYYLKLRKELYREYQAIYPNVKNFLNSTAVMRVNSYVAGRGSHSQLQKEIEELGLSPAGRKLLLGMTAR